MFQKELFQQRIKELRDERLLTQKEFSEFLGMSQPTLVSYERGNGKPPLDVLCNIADKCNASLDWLCGLSNVRQSVDKTESYADIIKVLEMFRQRFDISIEDENIWGYSKLTIRDSTLHKFFGEWKDMIKLLEQGTIRRELYNVWLADSIKKYDIKFELKENLPF